MIFYSLQAQRNMLREFKLQMHNEFRDDYRKYIDLYINMNQSSTKNCDFNPYTFLKNNLILDLSGDMIDLNPKCLLELICNSLDMCIEQGVKNELVKNFQETINEIVQIEIQNMENKYEKMKYVSSRKPKAENVSNKPKNCKDTIYHLNESFDDIFQKKDQLMNGIKRKAIKNKDYYALKIINEFQNNIHKNMSLVAIALTECMSYVIRKMPQNKYKKQVESLKNHVDSQYSIMINHVDEDYCDTFAFIEGTLSLEEKYIFECIYEQFKIGVDELDKITYDKKISILKNQSNLIYIFFNHCKNSSYNKFNVFDYIHYIYESTTSKEPKIELDLLAVCEFLDSQNEYVSRSIPMNLNLEEKFVKCFNKAKIWETSKKTTTHKKQHLFCPEKNWDTKEKIIRKFLRNNNSLTIHKMKKRNYTRIYKFIKIKYNSAKRVIIKLYSF